MPPRVVTTVRLTPEGRRALDLLAERMGMTQAATIELAVRNLAKRERIDLSDTDAKQEEGAKTASYKIVVREEPDTKPAYKVYRPKHEE